MILLVMTSVSCAPLHAVSVETLIEELNRSSASVTSYPTSIDSDLPKVYSAEMQAVEGAWLTKEQSLGSLSKSAKREQKNQFFQAEADKANAPVLEWTSRFGAASSKADEYRTVARKTLMEVSKHPVASVSRTYTRSQGLEIGYCFGRALLVHHALLKAGIPQHDMFKIFALGELMMEGQMWNFHVAVGVRDRKHGALIIDPLHNKILPVTRWIKETRVYDIKHPYSRTRFYVTDPRKFLPAFGMYHPDQLADPLLKDYFEALSRTR